MKNLFKLMNVSSEKQFNNLLESLDLNANEMIALYDIANNYKSLVEQRQDLLSLMASSSDRNYEIISKQLKKNNEPRRLKEDVNMVPSSELTLNNVMELNELIDLVAKKCQQNKMAAQQVYQMIAKSSSKNVADSFFAMVRNAGNTDDNLKFDTELVVDGNKVADVIYGMKNNIVTFLNSVEEPKKQPVKESVRILEESIDNIKNMINNANDKKTLSVIEKLINVKILNSKSVEEKNILADLKSQVKTKLNTMINECNIQDVVATACEEDTFNGLLKSIGKPTVINITVNKETGDIEDIPCEVVEPMDCPSPSFNNGAMQVQNVDTCPTALDTPILSKPNKAELVSAMTALNSHMDDIKTDCRENNIECLQTINTLLAKIGDYFNKTLSESVQLDERTGKVVFHTTFETPNGEYYEINGYESGEDEYEVDLLDDGYKHIATSIFNIQGAMDNEIRNALHSSGLNWNEVENKIQSKIAELQEELTEDTVYDHSWYEVDDGEYPQRTKDGVVIKEGIKDLFKKDNKQYRIMYGRNGGWISKDMKYIKGDIMDALIVTDYKKAQKLCDKLEPKQKNEKGLLHIEEIKHYPEEKDFEKTYEFLDIMDKLKNREITVEEIKKYLKDNKIHTNIDHYLMLYKPSKIKKEKEIDETCSAGATCAGGVAQMPKPFKSKKHKKVSIAESLFLDMILENKNVSQVIDGDSYKLQDGYFYKNGVLVKTKNLNEMVEFVLGNIELPLLEGFTPYQMEMVMEELDNNELSSMDLSPEQRQIKQQQEDILDSKIKSDTTVNVNVTDEEKDEIVQNQELIGVDDSDINNKKYVVKNPSDNSVKVLDATKIDTVEK